MVTEIGSPTAQLEGSCRRWEIAEIGVFWPAPHDPVRPEGAMQEQFERSSNWIRRKAILESAEPV